MRPVALEKPHEGMQLLNERTVYQTRPCLCRYCSDPDGEKFGSDLSGKVIHDFFWVYNKLNFSTRHVQVSGVACTVCRNRLMTLDSYPQR